MNGQDLNFDWPSAKRGYAAYLIEILAQAKLGLMTKIIVIHCNGFQMLYLTHA
jgi:hypothetical protein